MARQFLEMIKIEATTEKLIVASRPSIVALLVRRGANEQQAGELFDSFMQPAFEKGVPALMTRYEDILVEDFTVPELRSVLDNQQNEARQSAVTKVPKMQAQFQEAGRLWGQRIGRQVEQDNKETFKKLGLELDGAK